MSKTTIPTGGLADSAVTTAKITDATIASGDLADDAVTAAKITDNAVGAAALNISGNGTSGQAILSDGDGSFSYGAGGKTDEEIQDLVGAMFSSNTETGVTVTYQDGDGTIDVVVGTLNQDTTGNAATATLASSCTISESKKLIGKQSLLRFFYNGIHLYLGRYCTFLSS